jgi:UDP-2,3-diacylglucosamine hydrolase
VTTLFISDLHLDAEKPHLTEIFLVFIRDQAGEANALYLLGDIFEVWVGDDDDAELVTTVADELRTAAGTGLKIYFMHGNRDFLVGKAFAERAGVHLIEDPTVTNIEGVRTILAHGDRYCTDDLAYQAFRLKSRDPEWQAKILRLPLFMRRLIAWYGRRKSKAGHRAKAAAGMISDVVEREIVAEFERQGATRMIHGHTHRPAVHVHRTQLGPAERIVLSDWREFGEALMVRDDGTYARLVLDGYGLREVDTKRVVSPSPPSSAAIA